MKPFKHLLLASLLAPAALCGAEPIELKLWPEGAPGQMLPHSKATEDFIRTKAGKSTITDIHDPTITVYRPENPNGTSVIVAPGGGFVFLSAIHEGSQVCEWLNSIGVTGILLKYRTPTRDEAAPHEKPVADAAQAITLVRSHAKEWNLDPSRVGLLGFSAGGNLLAHIACDRDWARYPTNADQIKLSLPNFGIMIYGGGFVEYKDPAKLKEGFTVPPDAPPMFLACAHDDGQNPLAAAVLYLEYKKLGIPCELHLFTKGGHGFGMRDNKQPINHWPQRSAEWMNSMGLLPTLGGLTASIARCKAQYAELLKQANEQSLFSSLIDDDDNMRLEKKKQDVAREAAAAHAGGNMVEERRLQEEEKKLSDELKRRRAANVKLNALREEYSLKLGRIEKERLELEAERLQLIELQSSSKQP